MEHCSAPMKFVPGDRVICDGREYEVATAQYDLKAELWSYDLREWEYRYYVPEYRIKLAPDWHRPKEQPNGVD